MNLKHALTPLLFSVILSCGLALIGAEDHSIPADFNLCAEYAPGFSDWKPWEVTISADGKALQEVYGPWRGKETPREKTEKTSTLTEPQLQKLAAAVRTSQFFALKQRYSYPVTDNPTLTLRVRMDGSSREVKVYAPGHLKDDAEVRRFMKAWSAVLKFQILGKSPSRHNPAHALDAAMSFSLHTKRPWRRASDVRRWAMREHA